MNAKQVGLIVLASVSFGYFLHDLVDIKELFDINRIQNVSADSSSKSVLGNTSQDQFVTSVVFNGTSYQPNRIHVRKGNYVVVTNTSEDELMWLVSGESSMSMNRSYAQGEQLRFIASKEGVFELRDKHHASIGLKITISP